MATKKPSKSTARKAARILSNPKSSKAAKSAAGKTLAKRASGGRTIKPAPKTGKVKKSSIKRAVKTVKSSKSASKRRK